MRLHSAGKWLLAAMLAALVSIAYGQDGAKASPNAEGDSPAGEAQAERSWWDGDVWSNPQRGFNWYPPPKPRKKPQPPTKEAPQAKASVTPKNFRDIRDLEEFQKELRRLREVAIFDPTPTNVHTLLQAQEYAMSRSQLFADTARRVVWQNPDVDFTAKSPQANYSLANQRSRAAERKNDVLAALAKDHGLLFFFKSDCPYCHDMAPIMKMIEAQYGLEVMAVTLDGKGIKEFPNPKIDNGVSRFVSNGEGIQTVPAVYLVSNDKKSVVLLGTGALAMDELAERIRVLKTTKVGDDY